MPSNELTIPYFAYGANLNFYGMHSRCPGHLPRCIAYIENYKLVFRGVASIEQANGQRVYGAMYLLDESHMDALDRFEGYPRLYRREIMPIRKAGNNHHTEAWVYLMNPDKYGYSAPCGGYLETILDGCRDWNIPEFYLKQIIKIARRNR